MTEWMMSFVQSLCLLAYLYGAWLVITHRADAGPMRGRESNLPAQNHRDDEADWRRYLACDW